LRGAFPCHVLAYPRWLKKAFFVEGPKSLIFIVELIRGLH